MEVADEFVHDLMEAAGLVDLVPNPSGPEVEPDDPERNQAELRYYDLCVQTEEWFRTRLEKVWADYHHDYKVWEKREIPSGVKTRLDSFASACHAARRGLKEDAFALVVYEGDLWPPRNLNGVELLAWQDQPAETDIQAAAERWCKFTEELEFYAKRAEEASKTLEKAPRPRKVAKDILIHDLRRFFAEAVRTCLKTATADFFKNVSPPLLPHIEYSNPTRALTDEELEHLLLGLTTDQAHYRRTRLREFAESVFRRLKEKFSPKTLRDHIARHPVPGIQLPGGKAVDF